MAYSASDAADDLIQCASQLPTFDTDAWERLDEDDLSRSVDISMAAITTLANQAKAASAMLAALKVALPKIDGFAAGSANVVDAMKSAIAQAEAAGITAA